jgi:hypothetical protein
LVNGFKATGKKNSQMVPCNNVGLRLLVTASFAAIAPLGFFSATSVAAAKPSAVFAPPSGKLLLTRTLQRTLHDGKEVVTRRTYEVQFVRIGEGYRVDGNLVDVQVEVPPLLAALADIERKRPDNGMFPIMLDARGIIAGGDSVQDDGSLDRASTVVAGRFANSGLPAVEMLQAQGFMKQLRARRPRSLWPTDVFNPGPQPLMETRIVPVPGGGSGRVVIEMFAKSGAADGMITELERLVTTDLDGDKRVTRETWRLSRSAKQVTR